MKQSIVTNEDNMEMMARYPDKYFELAINIKYLFFAIAIVTTKYYIRTYENVKRIANREGGRILSLRRFNIKRLCGIPERTGSSIRCVIRYWTSTNEGASENNSLSKNRFAKIKRNQSIHFQCKKEWEKQLKAIRGWGNRLICFGLPGHQNDRIPKNGGYARHNKYQSGLSSRNPLRRKRSIGLPKANGSKRDSLSNSTCKRLGASCGTGKQDAAGGVYAI